MKAKDYLMKIQTLDAIINQKLAEKAQLEEALISISSINFSKERVQASSKHDAPYIKTVNRLMDLEEEIEQRINHFFNQKHKIINEIQSLDDVRYIQILFKKYVEYKSLEEIAAEMEYSYDRIKHIHCHALKAFETNFLKVDTQ